MVQLDRVHLRTGLVCVSVLKIFVNNPLLLSLFTAVPLVVIHPIIICNSVLSFQMYPVL